MKGIFSFLVFLLNFFVLQWFFIRLDLSAKSKIYFASPLSGFFNIGVITPNDIRFWSWLIAYISITGVLLNILNHRFVF